MDTVERSSVEQAVLYDGFISYSHAADGLLAPRLQAGLQRFAKPWWKRRALRVFRDETSLSANPHLWSSITEALDGSAWFVLLLSPDAAQSPWVNQEIEYWNEHKDPSRILPVVTDGEFEWTSGDVSGSAVPEALQGVFTEEPRWLDLRFAWDEEQLDLKNPRFSAALADIASALRGVPKDELESEEVKQHRRTIRTAWTAGVALAVLALVAVGASIQSARNAAEAERQAAIAAEQAEIAEANAAAEAEARLDADRQAQLAAARELAASSIAVLDNDPELSTLLAIRAISETPDGVEQPIEVINALWRAGSSNRLIDVYPTANGSNLTLSPDGARLAVSENQTLRMLDAATGEQLWSYEEDTVDFFHLVDIGPDGRVALGVLNSDAVARLRETDLTDSLPNRIVILDGDTGAVVHTLEYPDCSDVQNPVWSPRGRYLAVASGHHGLPGGSRTVGCPRDGTVSWLEVYDTGTWEIAALLPTDGEPRPVWDDAGALYGLSAQESVLAFDPETFEPRTPSAATGMGDVSPDGSRFVTIYSPSSSGGAEFSAFLFDAESGTSTDVLYFGTDYPSAPNGIEITPDGSMAVIGTHGSHTFVYDLTTNEELHRLATGAVFTSAYDPATQRLYTAGSDPGVKVWDLRPSTIGVEATGDLDGFTWVNGNSFVNGPEAIAMDTADLGTFHWQVQLFDSDTGELTAALFNHVAQGALANGKWVLYRLVESRTDATILWDPDTDEQIEILSCEVTATDDVGRSYCTGDREPRTWWTRVSSGGENILAYGSTEIEGFSYSGHFRLIDADTGEEIERIEPGDEPSPNDPFAALSTGPLDIFTDEWAFGATRGGTGSAAYDLATGEPLYQAGIIYGIELSPTLDLIAVNDMPASLTLFDTTTWQPVARIPTRARVRGLGFNADGSRLAIGGRNLHIVDTATGQVVQQMALANVSDIHWIDDETLLIGTNTGVFGTVSLSTDEFLATVREGLRRSFTDQECDQYRIDPCPTLDEMRGG